MILGIKKGCLGFETAFFYLPHDAIVRERGEYERDEMISSIEVAKNIAKILGTTVGYLLGETEEVNIFKDSAILNRFNDIEKLDPEIKNICFR